jgi:hypothetical protein
MQCFGRALPHQKPTLADFALSILRRELAMRVGWQRRVLFAEFMQKKRSSGRSANRPPLRRSRRLRLRRDDQSFAGPDRA